MSQTVKQFVTDAYQLISANSPTVPLQGNDMLKGVQFLNELIEQKIKIDTDRTEYKKST